MSRQNTLKDRYSVPNRSAICGRRNTRCVACPCHLQSHLTHSRFRRKQPKSTVSHRQNWRSSKRLCRICDCPARPHKDYISILLSYDNSRLVCCGYHHYTALHSRLFTTAISSQPKTELGFNISTKTIIAGTNDGSRNDTYRRLFFGRVLIFFELQRDRIDAVSLIR